MPPKAAVVRAISPTPPPPPPPPNDAQDILIIQDFMDTIDQIPVELTRVHSDLNELGAVLYCECLWMAPTGTTFSLQLPSTTFPPHDD